MYDTRNPRHDFEYELVLSFANAKPVFRIIELGLVASGEDVESAFQEISRLKQEYLAKARAADLLDTLPVPGRRGAGATAVGPAAGSTTLKPDFVSFLIKLSIVYASALLLLGLVALAIRPMLHVPVGKAFWAQAQEQLHRAAQSDGTKPEVLAQVRADLHLLVTRYKPIIDELRPLFADSAAKPSPDAK